MPITEADRQAAQVTSKTCPIEHMREKLARQARLGNVPLKGGMACDACVAAAIAQAREEGSKGLQRCDICSLWDEIRNAQARYLHQYDYFVAALNERLRRAYDVR